MLAIDGTLTVKSISFDALNTTMVLCPNAVVDLGGSLLTVSSLTLANGTDLSIHDLNNENATLTSPFKLSNGAQIINGTLIIDSTHPNAVHLVESNKHSNQAVGTVTLHNQN